MTRLRTDVACCRTDDGTVLLDERSGRYWQLNATGAAVLQALLDGASPRQIADRLADTRPVPRERAVADVTALVDRLTGGGLLVEAP